MTLLANNKHSFVNQISLNSTEDDKKPLISISHLDQAETKKLESLGIQYKALDTEKCLYENKGHSVHPPTYIERIIVTREAIMALRKLRQKQKKMCKDLTEPSEKIRVRKVMQEFARN